MDENEEEVALPGLGKKNAKRGRKPAITERVKYVVLFFLL